jgi:type VI secretion system FHA domain protein
MILVLEVVGAEGDKLGPDRRKEFRASGGTIGRLRDNAWVLPDPYVSSRHALIRYQNGVFQIEDTSTNGVFVNSPDNRLAPGQPYPLSSGDWIFIEPYEIRAAVLPKDDDTHVAALDDPFGPGMSMGRPVGALVEPDRAAPGPLVPGLDPEQVDPLSLLGFEPSRASAPPVSTAADLARNSVLTEHYQPPAPVPAPPPNRPPVPVPLIPDDYDPLESGDSSAMPPVDPAPVPLPDTWRLPSNRQDAVAPSTSAAAPVGSPSVSPTAGHASASREAAGNEPPRKSATTVPAVDASIGATLEAALASAGIKDVAVTPELAHAFGEILRVVVAGVMDILQARQRIKNEFRMRVTSFRPTANNPLKFSANVDDALHNLLVKRNPAYLAPVDAFEDAFADLRNHQMATLAGVRIAFESMLKEFDPDRLQEQFDRQVKKGALVAVPARLRYWDLYREKFDELVKDADGSFRKLFGDEFAKAYEEQLDRLKAQGPRR